MLNLRYLAAITALCVAAQDGRAQVLRDYKCVIKRLESGHLEGKALAFWRGHYTGKEFTVERRTGRMSGALKNSYVTKPEVIDLGSTANSFKVVTTMKREQGAGAGSSVYTLIVNEYDESATKPFVFLENDEVFFGTCANF